MEKRMDTTGESNGKQMEVEIEDDWLISEKRMYAHAYISTSRRAAP